MIIELLARTRIRRGELLALTADAVVQIGSAYWLRVPIAKLRIDRYIPLHPHLKALLTTGSPTSVLRACAPIAFCSNTISR